MTTQFEFLLNAMENASQQEVPFKHGYAEKRQAVMDYVASLSTVESAVSSPPQGVAPTINAREAWHKYRAEHPVIGMSIPGWRTETLLTFANYYHNLLTGVLSSLGAQEEKRS